MLVVKFTVEKCIEEDAFDPPLNTRDPQSVKDRIIRGLVSGEVEFCEPEIKRFEMEHEDGEPYTICTAEDFPDLSKEEA